MSDLKLHRNNEVTRKRKSLQNSLKKNIKYLSEDEELSGYALVTWDKYGNANSAFRFTGGEIVNHYTLPTFVCEHLRERITTGE